MNTASFQLSQHWLSKVLIGVRFTRAHARVLLSAIDLWSYGCLAWDILALDSRPGYCHLFDGSDGSVLAQQLENYRAEVFHQCVAARGGRALRGCSRAVQVILVTDTSSAGQRLFNIAAAKAVDHELLS